MSHDVVQKMRKEIDALDKKIIQIIARRLQLARGIGLKKRAKNMPIKDVARERALAKLHTKQAKRVRIDEQFVLRLFRLIMRESRRIQKYLL